MKWHDTDPHATASDARRRADSRACAARCMPLPHPRQRDDSPSHSAFGDDPGRMNPVALLATAVVGGVCAVAATVVIVGFASWLVGWGKS